MFKFESKEKTFLLHLFLTTFLGGVVGILNYAFNILIARYTSKEIFGIFSAALGIIYLSQISGMSIQSLVTKTVAKNKENDLNQYKWNTTISFAIIGVVASIIFFLFKVPISQLASIPKELILYLALAIIFAFISPVSKGLLLGQEKVITVNLLLLAETVMKFIIGIVAIKIGGNISLLIVANAIPPFLTTLFIIPMIKFEKKKDTEVKNNWKEFLLMTLSFLLLTMPFTIDLVLVNSSFRAEYSSLSLLGKIVYFACVTTSAVLFARLSNESSFTKQRKSLFLSILLSLFIGLFLSLIYFIIGEKIISLSVGDSYLKINTYLGMFGLCMTGYSIVYMIANYFIARGDYSYIWVLLSASILQITLFSTRNNYLNEVVQNQGILYTFLTLSTILFLLFNFKKNRNEENKSSEELK
ncbi:oligosaccharide flippase family protein [Candidatus Dojkabacteria bacterium]|uniref:Oligosaccharide flippase family protein n=1 Tax=Candidatus Dojkabacteria bacterium TaxID=2099670 RepID=A0A847CZJ0_9BACT|nr:oligosaccharide flippase family protein [Candidatus Dojkabacteria bacterium]